MARRRFFVDQVHSGHAEIRGENAHHLTRVLRVEAGQTFEISDSNRVWLATVESARKDSVRFSVVEEVDAGPGPLPVTLFPALIKFDRLEWTIEKATELGVERIVPVEAVRSERGLMAGSKSRMERWRRIAHESSEQCRRLRAPEIDTAVRFQEAVAASATHRIWLDEQPGAPLLVEALRHQPGDTVALMIGPEGGWTDTERAAFAQSRWTAASLGSSILRAETAACAALAVVAQLVRR